MHSTLKEIEDDPKAEVSLLLKKIVSRNLSYKETLDKNNSMMKEQLSAFCALKNQMISEIQQQQQNLQEANEKIFSLKKENSNLQKKLDSRSEDMCQSKGIKDFCTKEESVKECSQISSDTCKELADHKKIIKEKDEEINLIDRKVLMCDLKSSQEEVKRLNKELKTYQEKFDSSSRNSGPSSSRKNVSPSSTTKDHRYGGQPIVCAVCGDEFPNRPAANNHMNHYHIMS